MPRKIRKDDSQEADQELPLEFFACPNPDCACFNVFGGGNLSVAKHMGKDKAIRRLYCNICQSRSGSRRTDLLEKSVRIWRDIYNWARVHGSLHGRTPAMVLGLTGHVWSVTEYVCHPVDISDLQLQNWQETRKKISESALEARERKKALPIS